MRRVYDLISSIEFYTIFCGKQFYLTKFHKEVDKFEVYATYITGGIRWHDLENNTGWIKHYKKKNFSHGKLKRRVIPLGDW